MRLGNSRSPELVEVLEAVIDKAMDQMFVALPGKIELFNGEFMKANVKPLLKRPIVDEDGDLTQDDLGVINDVPVAFPRTSRFVMSFPLTKGDTGLLVFCDNSLDDYVYSSGKEVLDVEDLRRHDISDAVFIPGILPFTTPLTTEISSGAVFGTTNAVQVRVNETATEITSGGAPASTGGFVALASLVLAELNKIKIYLATHKHSGVTTGPGSTGVPVDPPPDHTLPASKNLKAD